MSVYSTIPLPRPRRTAHNLSHNVDTSCNIGELIVTARPIECVPGDTIDVSSVDTVDLMPLVKPFKGDLWFESWAFFVSNDMLYKAKDSGKFTDILVSAQNPKEALSLPSISVSSGSIAIGTGTYWDYLGLPVGVGNSISLLKINAYPLRAVYKIFDDYFRDENLQTERFGSTNDGWANGLKVQYVNYKKDRFTSAFTSEQKGNPITFNLGTTAPLTINSKFVHNNTQGVLQGDAQLTLTSNSTANVIAMSKPQSGTATVLSSGTVDIVSTGTADLSSAASITINDLRLANKLQKWEERLQLAGSRPKEYLLANYGICPNDETLQRPVLIGHIKTPVIVDSVVQNLPTDGVKAASKYGNGVSVSSTHFGKWLCKEFGWIIKLSCLRPKSNYTQGIHRSMIKTTVYDYFNPIFENLGQQEIINAELYAQNTSDDKSVWGFTDRYNEYRHLESMTTGALRSQNGLQPWVMNRKFGELPTLSESFIQVNPSEYDYLFNFEHSATVPQAIVHCTNLIKAIRPISKYAYPSL